MNDMKMVSFCKACIDFLAWINPPPRINGTTETFNELTGLKNERYLGEHICERRYAIRNETGNQTVRNKAIPTRVREPTAL